MQSHAKVGRTTFGNEGGFLCFLRYIDIHIYIKREERGDQMQKNVRRYIHNKPQKFKVVGFVGYNPDAQKEKENVKLNLNISMHSSLDVSSFLNEMVQAVV